VRVAYVCADRGVPVFGTKGSSVHVRAIVGALLRRGAEVDVFAARLGGSPPAEVATARFHRLPRTTREDAASRERASLAANADLRASLERLGPFDLVYERYSLWSHAGMEYARDTATPGVLEVNAPLIEEQATYRGLVDRAGAEEVAERCFGAAGALVAVSSGVAAHLEDQPAARGRVHTIPNGVDLARFGARAASAPGAPFTVGFVGTLKPWHGLETLIEAFDLMCREEAGARLLIVGDGPERDRLAADVARRGLSGAVRFFGAADASRVPSLLADMDVAVAPYPDLRPFYFSPLKVYEYMAAGLAVVVSAVGDIPDLVAHGEAGVLCAPGDAPDLARALADLRRDPALRQRLGRAARARVERRHTWDSVCERILELRGHTLTGAPMNAPVPDASAVL